MRRAITAIGLSAALLAATAGSASAATWTPASWDFGKVPVGSQTAFQDFTLTRSSGETSSHVSLGITENDNEHGEHALFQGFPSYPGGTTCPSQLNNSIPSCTIRVYFTPVQPGRATGSLISDTPEDGPPSAGSVTALLSGTGVAKKCKKGKKHSARSAKKKCKKK